MVTIMPNFRAQNWMSGNTTPDFKQGDRAWGGAVIAELPDLSTARISARVDESDRGRTQGGELRPAGEPAVRHQTGSSDEKACGAESHRC